MSTQLIILLVCIYGIGVILSVARYHIKHGIDDFSDRGAAIYLGLFWPFSVVSIIPVYIVSQIGIWLTKLGGWKQK
jgi:hypothetical protein